ncbi:MAG: hypothetical protein QG625_1290, partial [Cyanobacteriota bacterium erpe_2018_sw_39hr_WHONDRS-SW48-000098_B_bin.30]|nr:hypothetical protein [Cyanobacteriota bacterium erpe_2018_sw_39hr_WHONDRS-SW48-000098_B_bin.30]
KPFERGDVEHGLRTLACSVTGSGIGCSSPLSVLFSQESIRLLLALPSTYWFWRVCCELHRTQQGDTGPIALVEVEAAADYLHQSFCSGHDLSLAPLEMTQAELASRVELGLLLVQYGVGERDQLRLNRLFCR